LFAIDDAMGDVVARATEARLAMIKLAWWRESLERLDVEPPPGEPRLQAAAAELLPRGIKGHEIAGLEAGWATLLDDRPKIALVESRGATLFSMAARLLGGASPNVDRAGALYALMNVTRRHLRNFRSAADECQLPRFPPKLRPLTLLASLAHRDLLRGTDEPEATPGRSWALIRHRITGKL
jgi:15-cis-phytoene synthase